VVPSGCGLIVGNWVTAGNTSTGISWRWACESSVALVKVVTHDHIVYINLPICVVALVVLLISLRSVDVQRTSDTSWQKFGQKFDFAGL
jgi:hypothetical protein